MKLILSLSSFYRSWTWASETRNTSKFAQLRMEFDFNSPWSRVYEFSLQRCWYVSNCTRTTTLRLLTCSFSDCVGSWEEAIFTKDCERPSLWNHSTYNLTLLLFFLQCEIPENVLIEGPLKWKSHQFCYWDFI